ncbi:hypothetical protein [Mycolicibacterium lutetiense]|uniref:Uncharacterized protein n=1 Tax=Mycolicibacterium lutetiense TaxID=1641992 RepID=A0ABS4ZYP3_9MYCO|nr:hypothetical protein [Mycolicibacterium lutetiense]MBP2454647.1 hypothetical protein [Mycolicibacterium lutetiense]
MADIDADVDAKDSEESCNEESTPEPGDTDRCKSPAVNTLTQRGLFALFVVVGMEAAWLMTVKIFGLNAQLAITIASAWALGSISLYFAIHRDDYRAMEVNRRALTGTAVAACVILGLSGGVVKWVLSQQPSPSSDPVTPLDQFKLEGRWQSPIWADAITVTEPAAIVETLIEYKNRGDAGHNDVTLKIELPKGINPVRGSVRYGTSAHPDGLIASDAIWSDGMNIGSYAPGGGTYIVAPVQFDPNIHLPCGPNILPLRAIGWSSDISAAEEWTSNQLRITLVKGC